VGSLSVVRWTKYGHDRLYVKTLDGDPVGWGDLRTGVVTVTVPSLVGQLHAALAEHPLWPSEASASDETALLPTPGQVPPAATGMGSPATRPPALVVPNRSDELGWADLALTRAGSAARAQAVAEREAAPVRTFAARLLGVHTDERAWRIGADGEERVAAQLAKLVRKDPRWRTLHAIPVGARGSDIDHLVIGPGGVFTLNAKHHPGAKVWVCGDRFLVNGRHQHYVRNSRFEAQRTSKLLADAVGHAVPAMGVVVLVNADSLTVKEQPSDVGVVARMQTRRWLLSRPPVLDDAEVGVIYEAARRSTTWGQVL
jgi:hypothetical protein